MSIKPTRSRSQATTPSRSPRASRNTRDEFVRSGEAAAKAIDFAAARGWAHSPRVATAYATAAWAAWHRCDLDTAARFAPLAIDLLGEGTNAGTRLAALCVEAAVRFDRGEQRHALRGWRGAWREYDDTSLPPTVVACFMPVQAAMALALGDQAAVAEAIERLAAVAGGKGDVAVLRATLSARRSRADHARRLLRPVLDGRTPPLSPTTLIRAWLLEAVLAEAAPATRSAPGTPSRPLLTSRLPARIFVASLRRARRCVTCLPDVPGNSSTTRISSRPSSPGSRWPARRRGR